MRCQIAFPVGILAAWRPSTQKPLWSDRCEVPRVRASRGEARLVCAEPCVIEHDAGADRPSSS
jgi:hypothetical protein